MLRLVTLTVLALLLSAAAAPAQLAPTTAPPADAGQILIRTYDLSDLFRVPRDYPLPAEMVPATGLPGGAQPGGAFGAGMDPGMMGMEGMFGGPQPGPAQPAGIGARPVTAEAVAQLVMSTIAPESWRDAGGTVGTLRFLGNHLVVSHTAESQQQIHDLLNGIRDESGNTNMVRVQAWWVRLSPQDLRAIAGPAGEPSAAALKEVPDDLLTDENVYARGQTLGYDGQTVHIASGRTNTVVTGVDPVVGTQAVGYQLRTAALRSGVALQVTPQVMRDGKVISLDMHSIVSEITGQAPAVPELRQFDGSNPATMPVDVLRERPRISGQQFSTTARMPSGKKILIGGTTFDPAGADAKGDSVGPGQLYLIVEATAVR